MVFFLSCGILFIVKRRAEVAKGCRINDTAHRSKNIKNLQKPLDK
jgi:hypothetical protein